MSEHYDNHDTQPIQLPRVRRASFRDVPPTASAWSPEAVRPKLSIFDPINSQEPDGLKYYESLMIGDQVHIPVPAYDEEGRKLAGELDHQTYEVKSIRYANNRYEAKVTTDDEIEESISADFIKDGSTLEARIAERLLTQDGLDIFAIQEKDEKA